MNCGISQHRAAIGRWHLFSLLRPLKAKSHHHNPSTIKLRALRPLLCIIRFFLMLLLLRAGDVQPNPGPSGLQVCHMNARSLCPSDRSKRIAEIHSELCIQESFDIICISETWLKPEIADDILEIPGYQIYRHDSQNTGYNGVAMYARDSLGIKRRLDLELEDLELLLLEVNFQHKRTLIGTCYRPPGSNANEATNFIENFQTVLNNLLFDNPDSFFILGDFNDHCLVWDDDHRQSELGLKLVQLVNSNNLFQVITEPTHIKPNSSTLLDLIITDSPGYITESGVSSPIGDPYHCLIHCSINFNTAHQKCYSRLIWRYNFGDFNKLNNNLINAPWSTMETFDEIDDYVHFFNTLFLNTCKEHIPTKLVTIRPNDEPWMHNSVRRALRRRNRAFRRWKRNRTEENYAAYQHTRNIFENSKTTAMNNYYTSLSTTLTNPSTNSKEYWRLVKQLYGCKIKNSIPPLTVNNQIYSSAEEKCKIFNDYFTNKAKLPDTMPSLPQQRRLTNSSLYSLSFSESEVLKVLKGLDIAKATGPDGISNRLLKLTADSICRPLCTIFNKCMEHGKFPTLWKKAHVSPIFKANDRQNHTNYRPISLLSNIGKILERLVFMKLYDYCKSHGLLTWRNSAYKKHDSTINQLIYITHKIYDALDNGRDVCFVSLDSSAAFDRVWHDGLIFKLKEIGITGLLLDWFRNYLTDRYQRVVIEGKQSDWTQIKSGVPQGSILGPLLFLIYTNDIVDKIESDILLFADDTCLLEPLTNQTSMHKINRDLDRLDKWATQWLVKFNPSKTKYLIFSKKSTRVEYGPIYLQGKKLSEVDSHKHLGLLFTNTMTWDKHIDKICKDAGKRLTVIKRLPNQIAPLTKLSMYKTYIRPLLEYGSVIFDNCTKSMADQLESLQRQAIISSLRAYKNTANIYLQKESGLPSLQNQRTIANLVTLFKMYKGKGPTYLKKLVPDSVGTSTSLNLRNAHDIRPPKSHRKTNYFLKSFLPSTIRVWNTLSISVRNISSTDAFKSQLNWTYCKTVCYKPYLSGCSIGHIHLSRMRMKLSGLNYHRFKHKFIDTFF